MSLQALLQVTHEGTLIVHCGFADVRQAYEAAERYKGRDIVQVSFNPLGALETVCMFWSRQSGEWIRSPNGVAPD